MRVQKIGPVLLGLMVVVAVASPGCGGGGDTAGTGGASSSSSSSSSMSDTSSSSSGMGGGGGTGGGSNASHGPPATETVTAGEVCKSPNYKMVFTVGQPTQNQEKTTSPSYRLQGGLVGANGSLP